MVSAFCGVGILLYLAAWASLPPDSTDPPRGGVQNSQLTRVLVYLGIAAASLHALHQLATGQLDFLIGLLVLGGLLYLLQVTRGEHRPDVAYAAAHPPAAGSAPSAFGSTAAFTPGEPPGPRPPRSRVTPMTLALALLAAGVTGVVPPIPPIPAIPASPVRGRWSRYRSR